MGSCVGCGGCAGKMITKKQNMELAHRIFMNIDIKRQGQLNKANLSEYFKEYTESSVRVILNGIDLDQDQIITKNEWMAYWEYVKLGGYNNLAINTSLKRIDAGIADLPFSNTSNYKTSEPRTTLIKDIELQLRKDPAILPFLIEPNPTQT